MEQNIQTQNTLSLFRAQSHEKGGREWNTFSAIAEDHSGAFRVAIPRKSLVVNRPGRFLRIIAPQPPELRGAH